jgi:hypothetical protein
VRCRRARCRSTAPAAGESTRPAAGTR